MPKSVARKRYSPSADSWFITADPDSFLHKKNKKSKRTDWMNYTMDNEDKTAMVRKVFKKGGEVDRSYMYGYNKPTSLGRHRQKVKKGK